MICAAVSTFWTKKLEIALENDPVLSAGMLRRDGIDLPRCTLSFMKGNRLEHSILKV